VPTAVLSFSVRRLLSLERVVKIKGGAESAIAKLKGKKKFK
jgi:hypothetical protein